MTDQATPAQPAREIVLEVTVRDVLTGDTQTAQMPRGEYVVICTEPASYAVQAYANGTHVVTVKGRVGR